MILGLLFNFFLVLWGVFYTFITLPVLLFPSRVITVFLVHSVRVVLFMLRLLCGVEYVINGIQNIPEQPIIIASKHQSSFETLIFILLFRNAVFVLKRELKWMPFIGLYLMALKMIFINRLDGVTSMRRIIKLSKARIKENRSIIIFPEGTRTILEQKSKYRSGVAVLYKVLSVPVLPVALNTGFFWPKGLFSMKKKPGKAIIEILPPIYPGLSMDNFLESLEKKIEEKSKELGIGKTSIANQ